MGDAAADEGAAVVGAADSLAEAEAEAVGVDR